MPNAALAYLLVQCPEIWEILLEDCAGAMQYLKRKRIETVAFSL